MKALTRPALYNYLLQEQANIQSTLDEDADGPNAEVRRGAWAMAQRIIEDFGLRPQNEEMH